MPTRPIEMPEGWTVARIGTEYLSGKTTRALAAETGISKPTIIRLLRRSGVELRRRGSYSEALKASFSLRKGVAEV